jgi:hypothetical protein
MSCRRFAYARALTHCFFSFEKEFPFAVDVPGTNPCGIRDKFIACSRMITAMFKSMSQLGDNA